MTKSNKKLMEESILLALDETSKDMRQTAEENENKVRAETIKLLAEAYNLVHRGRADNDRG